MIRKLISKVILPIAMFLAVTFMLNGMMIQYGDVTVTMTILTMIPATVFSLMVYLIANANQQ